MKKTILQPMVALMVALSIAGCSSNNAQEQGKAPSAESPSAQSSEPAKEEKGTRANPIPIGETATVKDGKVTLEITVEEVLRGDDVWTVARPDSPTAAVDSGCEYIAIKARIKAVAGADDKSIDVGLNSDFKSCTSTGEVLNSKIVSMLDGKSLYGEVFTGGEKEGYSVFQVKTGDNAPIVGYADTWFALS